VGLKSFLTQEDWISVLWILCLFVAAKSLGQKN
jgi:hypothetical protein